MAFYRMSGSSKGELHGASILVTVDGGTSGETVTLTKDTFSKSGVLSDDGTCLFTDLLEDGTYTATYQTFTADVEVSASDILNKVTKTIALSTTVTINLILEGAREDTITITDKNGATVGVCVFPSGSTVGEVEVDIVDGQEYTFTSSVAKDTKTGTSDYSKTVVLTDEKITTPMILVVGNTYKFAGYNWTCAEAIDGGYCLQSQGVTADTWTKLFGSSATTSQDGVDCHSNNIVLNDLYNKINNAEKSASYGSGLFLVSNAMCGTTTLNTQGSGHYWTAIKNSAINFMNFGAGSSTSQLGTIGTQYSSSDAWFVNNIGELRGGDKTNIRVIAPAFNIDPTKAKLVGDEILIPNTIKVMPETALYWYGNECIEKTGGWDGTRSGQYSYTFHSCTRGTKGKNYLYMGTPSTTSSAIYFGTSKMVNTPKISALVNISVAGQSSEYIPGAYWGKLGNQYIPYNITTQTNTNRIITFGNTTFTDAYITLASMTMSSFNSSSKVNFYCSAIWY